MQLESIARRIIRKVGRRLVGTITHVITEAPVVALTFDDGPHPVYTPKLLDVLDRHGAKATFFMVGEAAQQHPGIVRRVAEAGHEIGNHTWNHKPLTLLSGRERRQQLRACKRALHPYGGKLFRPPNGDMDIAARLDVSLCGYRAVTWSALAQDWFDHDSTTIAERVRKRIESGGIIVLHDALYTVLEERYANQEPTVEAVNLVLSELKDQFHFITMSELLQRGKPYRRIWRKKEDRDFLSKLRRAGS